MNALHLFVDESQRRPYLLVAGIVDAADLARNRAVLRGMCAPGDRRLHFQSERDSRRRELLARLVRANLHAWIYAGYGRPEAVRRACLDQMVTDALKTGAGRLVLESRGDVLDRSDRQTITRAIRVVTAEVGTDQELPYMHLRPHEEPMLWLADAVAWSYGAGAEWRRRARPLIDAVIELGNIR